MNDDYIILRDEDGKAYIAHAGWLDNAKNAVTNAAQQVANKAKGVGRGVRQNHKYILKVMENGKARYFYKQEEVKAYYEAKKRGIKNAAEYAQNAVKDKASEIADKAKQGASTAKNAFRETTGQAARDRMDEAANRRDNAASNMRNTNARRQKAENDKTIAEQERAKALTDIKNARTAQRGLQEKIDKDTDRINAVDRKKNMDEYTRLANSWNLSQRALNTQRQKEMDGYRRENIAENKRTAAKKEIDSATSEHRTARNDYHEAENEYNKNKAAYDKSLAGAVDRTAARARDVASDAREAASSAYNKAKDSANNTVTNAKNRFERMKSEFRDKAEQAGNAAKSAANKVVDKAKDIAGYDEKERLNKARDTAWNLASKGELTQQALDQLDKSEKQYNKTPFGMIQTAKNKSGLTARKAMKDFEAERDHTSAQDDPSGIRRFNADSAARAAKQAYQDSPLGKIETLPERVQGMIDNARSSTAKAVNEAWDRIPKNADGTVNPFDKNFKSTYNDWKAKKDKYDSSLAGRAKDTAEKATDAVQDMIDKAKQTARDAAASAQSTIDNATGNNYRKRAQEANQAAENAINQRSRTNDQLENQRSRYGSKENDREHIYGDSEGYYYKTKEQRDRAEALISKRDQYDADIVNNNRASKVNDSMYADSKAGKINDILGRSNISTSERANSKATEVQNKWDRQEAESKLIGGRLDPNINVSKEYVYSRASNSGMASEVSKVMQLEAAMRSAERAYESLGNDTTKPQSSSRAARQKMLKAQDAYEKAYEELIDDINKQYDQDLAAYEKQYGKYAR